MMRKIRIGIIDYQAGNLGSVYNAFRYLQDSVLQGIELEICIESIPDKLASYDKLLLPGVGAFGNAMKHLQDSHLDEAIKAYAHSGKELLGICLGMQLLFEKSEEFGEHKGLGLISGEVVVFHKTPTLKVPHVGWNSCHFTSQASQNKLLLGIEDKSFFYFVHSFYVRTQAKFILAHTHYGDDFTSIVAKDNLYGIQPHPEKSHYAGLGLLANFIKM